MRRFVLLLLLLTTSAYAQDTTYLTLVDLQDNTPIANSLVTLQTIIADNHQTFTLLTDSNGRIGIQKEYNQTLHIEFYVDDVNSEGKDYYGEYDLTDLASNNTISLQRTGSLRGLVRDTQDNALVDVHVYADCVSKGTTTDRFGAFYYDYLPAGTCRIFVRHEDTVVHQDSLIEHGRLSDLTVTLDETSSSSIFLLVLLSIAAAIGVAYFILQDKKGIDMNPRTKDIMSTLSTKERLVVRYLMDKKKAVSQNNISRNTGIPATSLSRTLDKLEEKKIVEIEKIGKYKKAKINSWFLGK